MDRITKLREAAALKLFDSGSVRVDFRNGFRLKVHDTYPEAPPSPIYISIRPLGVKDGKLSPSDIKAIAVALVAIAESADLFWEGRYWAGIPNAGTPLADMVSVLLRTSKPSLRRFCLQKTEDKHLRRITSVVEASFGPPEKTQKLLLIDDVVTAAVSKMEALGAIEAQGGSVSDLLVFLDRSVGGTAELLLQRGVRLHSVWKFEYLLDFYLAHGRISRRDYDAIISFPKQLAAYMMSQH